MNRSSRLRCFIKKGVFKNFAKVKGKHLCQRLLFNKVAGLRPNSYIAKKNLFEIKHQNGSTDESLNTRIFCTYFTT